MKNEYFLRESLAERVLPEHLNRLTPIFPRLSRNIDVLAPLKYAQDQWRRYLEKSQTDKNDKWLWMALLVVAAIMVSRAPYMALAGVINDDWRSLVAIIISGMVTLLVDWAIATYNTGLKCRDYCKRDHAEINSLKQKGENNQLIIERAEAYEDSLHWAKDAYHHPNNILMVVLALFFLVAEYAISLYLIKFQGNELDFLTLIIPLFGIAITVLEALFKYHKIDLQKARRQIADKYPQLASQLEQEKQPELKQELEEFQILEGLTQFVINYPYRTPEQLEAKEQDLRQGKKCAEIQQKYDELMRNRHDEVNQIVAQIHSQYNKITDRQELEQKITRDIDQIDQKYSLEFDLLDKEANYWNCPITPQLIS